MIVFSKGRKVEALKRVFIDARECMSSALSEHEIVGDANYETSVFLYYLMLQRYYNESIIEILRKEIALLVSQDCKTAEQAETLENRMRVYIEVSHGVNRPRGFWLLNEPSERTYSSAKMCAMISFGDFLVYPECATDYYHSPFPVFDIFDLPPFMSAFTGEVWSMYEAYLKGIGLK